MQTPIITALVFVAIYQFASRNSIPPKVSASIIAFVPLIFILILRSIFGASVLNLVQWSDILTLVLQFMVSFFVFHRLEYDDSASSWIIWGLLGLAAVTLLVPSLVLLLMFM